jgi:hypothetical protein
MLWTKYEPAQIKAVLIVKAGPTACELKNRVDAVKNESVGPEWHKVPGGPGR